MNYKNHRLNSFFVLIILCTVIIAPYKSYSQIYKPPFRGSELPVFYHGPWSYFADLIHNCYDGGQAGIDDCALAVEGHFSGRLEFVEAEVLRQASAGAPDSETKARLSAAQQRAAKAYRRLRYLACDDLGHAAYGLAMHSLRAASSCHVWLDFRRRSMLRETIGLAPMAVRDNGHGPYRLYDIYRAAGKGDDRLANLQGEESASLKRLASARRRVRRVLDDWEIHLSWVYRTRRYAKREEAQFEHYRAIQCEDYTPKLAAATPGGPLPQEAILACRTLLTVEQAVLLRDLFSHQELMSVDRKNGLPVERRTWE